jgi:hypothetical protein
MACNHWMVLGSSSGGGWVFFSRRFRVGSETHRVLEALSVRVKRPGLEADHSPSAEVKE